MEYFKTDGIRMNSRELIFSLLPLKLGRILGEEGKKICVGFDTRISSSEIFDLLVTGLVTRGCEVLSLDVCPTSMVGYITKKEECDFGIMITASHNPYFDNGIKIFNSKGEKLSELEEREIEEYLLRNTIYPKSYKLGKVINNPSYLESYCSYLRSLIDFNFEGKVLVDTSNGVLSDIFVKVFDGKLDYTLIEASPNGKNINENCGSEHISNLINKMDESFDLGISFDGDGDRLVIVNKDKEIITGEDLLYLFAREYNYSKIVTTKMSSFGLEETLKKENKEVIYSDVGDKKVFKKMKEENIYLGGEPSGHIIFFNSLVTNDAMFTLIKYFNMKNKDFSYPRYLNKTINLSLDKKYNLEKIKEIEKIINIKLNNEGRVYIRKSGTENLLRINIQLKDSSIFDEVFNNIKELL